MSANFDPEKHDRRSIRLHDYDYSWEGAYFITICVQGRSCLFGEINEYEMHQNEVGLMIRSVWDEMPLHYPGVYVDSFVVMPNHIHGIILLTGHPIGESPASIPNLSLADVVHRFKTMTTKRYTDGVKQNGWSRFEGRLWQRNYFEHIIRGDESLNRIRQYIDDNPSNWVNDVENPDSQKHKEYRRGI